MNLFFSSWKHCIFWSNGPKGLKMSAKQIQHHSKRWYFRISTHPSPAPIRNICDINTNNRKSVLHRRIKRWYITLCFEICQLPSDRSSETIPGRLSFPAPVQSLQRKLHKFHSGGVKTDTEKRYCRSGHCKAGFMKTGICYSWRK